jgi:hypothetical protein
MGSDKVIDCDCNASAADLRERLKSLVRKSQPCSKRIPQKGVWVEPKLLDEIEYRAKWAERKVRHPSSKGSERILANYLAPYIHV